MGLNSSDTIEFPDRLFTPECKSLVKSRQSEQLFEDTVLERAKGEKPNDIRQRANDLIQAVSLAQRSSHRATELSGGEQQRVAIARVPANQPRLVLADEPTGNLDEDNARAVANLLPHSCKERKATLIVATHDPHTPEAADRVLSLHSGSLREVPLDFSNKRTLKMSQECAITIPVNFFWKVE